MEWFDTMVLVIVAATALFGWRRGLATQVASIVSIVASVFLATRFSRSVSELIDAPPPWNNFAALLVLYLGTSLVIWLVFRQVRKSIEELKLKEFDRQMGALFGAAKGCLLACVVTVLAIRFVDDAQREAIVRSRSGRTIAQVLHRAEGWMPDNVRGYLAPYLEELQRQMPPPGGGWQAGHDPPPDGNPFSYPNWEGPSQGTEPPIMPPFPGGRTDSEYVPPGSYSTWPLPPDWRATTPPAGERY